LLLWLYNNSVVKILLAIRTSSVPLVALGEKARRTNKISESKKNKGGPIRRGVLCVLLAFSPEATTNEFTIQKKTSCKLGQHHRVHLERCTVG
jgi:hypothetical protein